MPPHNVFLARFLGGLRDHHAIFVQQQGAPETSEDPGDCGGHLFHVIGTVAQGMSFGHRPCGNPELSPTFLSKEYLGVISKGAFDRIEAVVNQIKPPERQFDKMKRMNPKEPLRDCQHWAADAVQALRDAEILKNG
ncbi:MAG: hypothetical protein Q9160_006767 [Pyrenula sp. 1 TL-2023]